MVAVTPPLHFIAKGDTSAMVLRSVALPFRLRWPGGWALGFVLNFFSWIFRYLVLIDNLTGSLAPASTGIRFAEGADLRQQSCRQFFAAVFLDKKIGNGITDLAGFPLIIGGLQRLTQIAGALTGDYK